MSCALWGSNWRGKTVKCICDNAAVVMIINPGWSKDNLHVAMHLKRCLSFFLSNFNILVEEHLPGKDSMHYPEVTFLFFTNRSNTQPCTPPHHPGSYSWPWCLIDSGELGSVIFYKETSKHNRAHLQDCSRTVHKVVSRHSPTCVTIPVMFICIIFSWPRP